MSNYNVEHNISRGPEKINGYNSGRSPYDYGKCPKGFHWVRSYTKDNGERVKGHCSKDPERENPKFQKSMNNYKLKMNSGQWDGEGSDPLEAANSIMRKFEIPYSGWDGEYEYFNDSGDIIDDNEFNRHGGDFSTVFSKDGYTYNVSGTVYKNKGKWKAGAEMEKVDF